MHTFRYLSLFSGIGGFEVGINNAYPHHRINQPQTAIRPHLSSRWHRTNTSVQTRPLCVGYSEINPYADKIYQRHFPQHHNWGDITKIVEQTLPDFDLLCGGFPCQSFSIAGTRKGFNDPRGTLFFEIARIIKNKQPQALLFENVKGLLSHQQGGTILTILSLLDELGYDCQWQVLNSCHWGLPQNRERIYIVGHHRRSTQRRVFPLGRTQSAWSPTHSRQSDIKVTTPHIRRLSPVECERLQGFPDHWTQGLSKTQRYNCLGNAVSTYVVKHIIETMYVPRLQDA